MDTPNRVGVKRSRPEPFDQSVPENVREMLNGHFQCWSADFTRLRMASNLGNAQVSSGSTSATSLGRKRVCCALETNQPSPRSYKLWRTRKVGRTNQIEYHAHWDKVLTESMNIATSGVFHTPEVFIERICNALLVQIRNFVPGA